MRLLADTSALLAYFLRNEADHESALRFLRSHPQATFVMTELVLGELVTRLRARSSAARAAAAAADLLASRRYSLVFVDDETCCEALAQMTRFADKRLSFTDCASFAVMLRLDLHTAFTFDRDFRDCGFAMVP